MIIKRKKSQRKLSIQKALSLSVVALAALVALAVAFLCPVAVGAVVVAVGALSVPVLVELLL